MSFVIAFDLNIGKVNEHHPKHSKQAYEDIARTLKRYGFERVQGSVYPSEREDLAKLFEAITALKALDWFGPSVKNIQAFRMAQGSDFTGVVKG